MCALRRIIKQIQEFIWKIQGILDRILFSTLRLCDLINNNNKRIKVIFILMFLVSLPVNWSLLAGHYVPIPSDCAIYYDQTSPSNFIIPFTSLLSYPGGALPIKPQIPTSSTSSKSLGVLSSLYLCTDSSYILPCGRGEPIKAARHRSPGISLLKTRVPSRTQVLRDHLWTITIKLKREDFVCPKTKNEFVRHLDRTQCAFVSLLVQWWVQFYMQTFKAFCGFPRTDFKWWFYLESVVLFSS